MKTAAIASAVFVAAVTAQPHGHGHQHKHAARAIVTKTEWVTEIQYVTELVDSTTTLWITPGQAPAPTAASIKGNFFEPPSPLPQAPPTSAAAPPPPPPPPPPPQPNTVYQPAPPPPNAPAPPPNAPAPPAPAPPPPPPPSPPQQPPPANGGGQYQGDITYFAVGLGSCGFDDSGKDNAMNIVALAGALYAEKGNLCNRNIVIHGNGKSVTAQVRDKCPPCTVGSIDVSEKVYKELWGSLDSGRMPVEWSFVD
ncbi:hypothetical protein TCAP_04662 [Tolypocladium capitatum]|uniref:Allergen Asp f 7 n=1 Tax=Tolypocladium capitatum TaxID=45235 RepID=A0A2K3QD12_9HYPO|nr:hypothetical protein TCAP_04662 [Tolypocladium capitatum]